MTFWDNLFWRILHPNLAAKTDVLTFAYGASTAEKIMKEEGVEVPPTIGEMANTAAINVGRVAVKVFKPILWILGGIVFLFILWAFIGRK